MDNNLISDYTQWEAGKDYPEFFDEISLATISKDKLSLYLAMFLFYHIKKIRAVTCDLRAVTCGYSTISQSSCRNSPASIVSNNPKKSSKEVLVNVKLF